MCVCVCVCVCVCLVLSPLTLVLIMRCADHLLQSVRLTNSELAAMQSANLAVGERLHDKLLQIINGIQRIISMDVTMLGEVLKVSAPLLLLRLSYRFDFTSQGLS